MTLFEEPHFTFRFADDRLIARFHIAGVLAGRRVSVFRIDPATGERVQLIAAATAGDGGWVDLPEPIVVRAGDAFIAAPGEPGALPNGRALTAADRVRLRPVEAGDLPRMCDLQLDPDSNRVARSIPRTPEAFHAHWAKVLGDPAVTARAVLWEGVLAGTVSCFPADGRDHVGYWLDRAYWGMGVASRALHLLLREVTKRPLFATATTSNAASLRVLRKCGFVVERVGRIPACDRFEACEKATLVLK